MHLSEWAEDAAFTVRKLRGTVGVGINAGTALLFLKGRKQDLNIRGAFLHMASDTLVSLGVVAAGCGMRATGWLWLDPVASLTIALVIVIATGRLFYESFNLVIDSVPSEIDIQNVREYLESLPEVESVHDLHIWAMSTTENALTAHLVKPSSERDDELISRITRELNTSHRIDHITIQWERSASQVIQ